MNLKFDSYNFRKNKCFILFIEKDNVDKDDIKLLVESSNIYIISILRVKGRNNCCVNR